MGAVAGASAWAGVGTGVSDGVAEAGAVALGVGWTAGCTDCVGAGVGAAIGCTGGRSGRMLESFGTASGCTPEVMAEFSRSGVVCVVSASDASAASDGEFKSRNGSLGAAIVVSSLISAMCGIVLIASSIALAAFSCSGIVRGAGVIGLMSESVGACLTGSAAGAASTSVTVSLIGVKTSVTLPSSMCAAAGAAASAVTARAANDGGITAPAS